MSLQQSAFSVCKTFKMIIVLHLSSLHPGNCLNSQTSFRQCFSPLPCLQKPKEEGGKQVSDQQLPPFVIVDDHDKPVGRVEDGDAVVIFNFRADRVVELSKALDLEKFDKFDRKRYPKVRLDSPWHLGQGVFLSLSICIQGHAHSGTCHLL